MTADEAMAWAATNCTPEARGKLKSRAAAGALADEVVRLRRALHEIAEEWAGAECGEPVYAQEAYAIWLAKRMYALAVEGLTPTA